MLIVFACVRSYIMSDVIVYVNTVPAKRESMYLDRVLEFVEKSQTGVSSAEMPSLILVYNQCSAWRLSRLIV
jgi:hypothetical protein